MHSCTPTRAREDTYSAALRRTPLSSLHSYPLVLTRCSEDAARCRSPALTSVHSARRLSARRQHAKLTLYRRFSHVLLASVPRRPTAPASRQSVVRAHALEDGTPPPHATATTPHTTATRHRHTPPPPPHTPPPHTTATRHRASQEAPEFPRPQPSQRRPPRLQSPGRRRRCSRPR